MFVDHADGLHNSGTGLGSARAAKSSAGGARVRSPDRKSVIAAALAFALLATTAPSNALAQTITMFNYVPGAANSAGSAAGISADGSTVVGYGFTLSSAFEAFVWTQATGVVPLGFAPGFTASSFATAVNGDGTVVVGYGTSATALQGFEWTPAGGIAGLGFAPGDTNNEAAGVNGGGSVVVGVRESDTSSFAQAFSATAATGMVALGTLPGGSTSLASAVNADGTVVVGESDGSGALTAQAVRWTQATGMVGLGGLAGAVASTALGVSGDGSTVVGSSEIPGSVQAFRWTEAGGMIGLGTVGLGTLVPDVDSVARAANTDGSVVVGTSYGPAGCFGNSGSVAFRWTAAGGMENIETELRNAGAIGGTFCLLSANAVSADGTIIAGDGITGSGENEAWVAHLPLLPPSPLLAAGLPESRSAQVGSTVTAFATMINTGAAALSSCSIVPGTLLPTTFLYQTTNPLTNALTGTVNTPTSIAGNNASQSFVIAFTPSAAFPPTNVPFGFDCATVTEAPIVIGLNTLLLSASTTPTPDIVALGATIQNDGIVHVTGTPSAGVFAVATVNLGSGDTITVAANTGAATLPLTISLCQTNPQTGQCLQPAATTVATTINPNDTPTFGIFVSASGGVAFNPANNRIFATFTDSTNTVRGETSVAVETQ